MGFPFGGRCQNLLSYWVSVYCDYNIYGMLREDYVGMQGING